MSAFDSGNCDNCCRGIHGDAHYLNGNHYCDGCWGTMFFEAIEELQKMQETLHLLHKRAGIIADDFLGVGQPKWRPFGDASNELDLMITKLSEMEYEL